MSSPKDITHKIIVERQLWHAAKYIFASNKTSVLAKYSDPANSQNAADLLQHTCHAYGWISELPFVLSIQKTNIFNHF